MANLARPVPAYVASILAGAQANQGADTTATAVISDWLWRVPFAVSTMSVVSNDPEVWVYRSMDGGNNFDTPGNPWMTFSIARDPQKNVQRSVDLPTGIYAFRLRNFTSTTAVTFQILTAEALTAVNLNV